MVFHVDSDRTGHRDGLRVLHVLGRDPSGSRGADRSGLLLFEAMRAGGVIDPWMVAAADSPSHSGTPWATSPEDPQQVFMAVSAYEPFFGRQHNRRLCTRDFAEFLQLVEPDVVHFHQLEPFGYDFVRQAHNTCPDAALVVGLGDYRAICGTGEMLLRNGERCWSATPERCHACLPDRSTGQHFLRKRWLQSALDLADRFLAPSHFARERYVEWGLAAEKIEVLARARRPSFPSSAGAPRVSEAPTRFGYFGGIRESKGVLVLLRAAQILDARQIPVEIALHGDPDADTGFRERFLRELGKCPPSVSLLPTFAPRDLDRQVRTADWIVVPSLGWETSEGSILDAFANRRPVIASDVGSHVEMVRHDVDGLRFPVGDAGALAEVIAHASCSRALWQRLSDSIGLPWSPAESAAAHDSLYRSALAGRRDRAISGRRS